MSRADVLALSESWKARATTWFNLGGLIAIAQAEGVNSVPPALGACFGASFGFMLPVSTPPNAIVYGSGLVPIAQMIRTGVLFDIAGLLIIWTGLRVMCPLLGLA